MSITYQQAKRIRKVGLMSLFADQLMYEKKVTTAIRKTISLKTRGRIMGLTQYLDPLNIAKVLTFGSALGPALLGHFMGRDPRDIQYFTGRLKPIRERSKTGDKITKLTGSKMSDTDGMSVILRKMHKLMAGIHEENVKRYELTKNREEERQLEDERRHKELIEALGGLGGTTVVSATKEEEGDGFFGKLINGLKEWAERLLQTMLDKALKAFEWIKDIAKWGKDLLMGINWAPFLEMFTQMAPVTAFFLPWLLTALEKEKIRANPNAPEYQDNPYAMYVRGEAKTEGEAAEINRRKTFKQVRRNEIAEALKGDFDDGELRDLYGADRKTLQDWLNTHTKPSDMWQGDVMPLEGTNRGGLEQGQPVKPVDKTQQTRAAQEVRADFAKTDPRLVTNSPISEKLNTTVTENLDTKLTAAAQKSAGTTQYNNNTVNTQQDKTIPIKRDMPSVRMTEPEFQNRIYSNTVTAN